jgi:Acetyltransferase (GNAT) family
VTFRTIAANALRLRRKLLYAADVGGLRDCSAKAPVVYRLGGINDLPRFSENFYGAGADQSLYSCERLNAGDWLVLAERDGEVLYAGWVMFGQIDLGVRNLRSVGAKSVASYRLFTRQDQRGNRLCAAYFAFLKRELLSRGINRVVSWVELRNAASRKVHESAGFRPLGVVWHLRLLGRSYFWMSSRVDSALTHSRFKQGFAGEATCV